ncbi:MAG TPA: alpha/beta fold hydrolase [Solirubrobacteraceae bacterium]|jgi:class II poly(R)-hydroxyalkanoic acid synthase|nr:alpha/beta fold hydrolase [Solirubrobacteraceae bacterium]
MATEVKEQAQRGGDAIRSGLDVMLSDAVAGTPRFFAPGPAVKVAAGLARRPRGVARRAAGLTTELTRTATGRSRLAPAGGDRRFADPAWQENWLLRELLQAYLAIGQTVDGLIEDAGVDWRTERQARLAVGNVMDALAPTNFPWSNPAVLREIVNTGGGNLAKGLRRLARDLSTPPRLPATVDTSQFEVGGNLAVSPGSVVLRNEVLELIHYQPQTDQVRETPLLVIPPTINKYYILDLAPGRSLIEYLVAQGQQVFAVSWRNPDQEQGHFDLDTYARAISEAREAVAEITHADAVHIAAACSGGIVTAGLLGHLAGTGELGEVASLTLMVCALDNAQAGTVSALATRDLAAAAVAESARKGYVDGQALAGVFTWLRPNDLVWSYVVNNYLLGKEPPAFDILYWNQDTVRMAAGLHRDFVHIGLENSFTRPGALQVLGTPVDMSAVNVDVYAVAGLSDHIVPWENAYRSAQLFGGSQRFVLARSGHIQALVNPPPRDGTESRASYRAADDVTADAEAFAAQTPKLSGSWWPDWDAWLAARSGAMRRAPRALGNRRFRAQAKAPGSYVLAS